MSELRKNLFFLLKKIQILKIFQKKCIKIEYIRFM